MTYLSELTARLGKALGMKGAPVAGAAARTDPVEPNAQPRAASTQASAGSTTGGQ